MKNTVERYWELNTSASALNSCGAAKSAVFQADGSDSADVKKRFLRYALDHLAYAQQKITEELEQLK
jgi:hypothetical protein